MGWVNRRRDHGNLIFLDCVTAPGSPRSCSIKTSLRRATPRRNTYVRNMWSRSQARCAARPNVINPKMATGEIEVAAQQLLVLNDSRVPPFSPAEEAIANEELRLKYRYIDLRRQQMQHNFELRHKITLAVRESLSNKGFSKSRPRS